MTSKLTYITIEPSIRIAPFKSNFYLFGGPRIAINQEKSFVYKQQTNPSFPQQIPNADVVGDFSEIEETIFSMQVGMGFDIPISSQTSKTQWLVSPFISFHPYFGQQPRGIETLSISTVRTGFVLKFGQGKRIDQPFAGEVQFTVVSPTNVAVEKRVREVFPIRNYVFFDEGSSQIPTRYVLLNKSEVANFKEDKVELNTPKNMSGRSERQMIVYYNILNILGDRMSKNPNSKITLIGSSNEGAEDGKAMATSIKSYLVSTFDINPNRIAIEGTLKPEIPSEQPGGKLELDLLRQGDRRVSIESNSPELLMEFQSGPETPLKPIEIISSQQKANSEVVVFDVQNSQNVFNNWTLKLTDERGKTQNYGPYTESKVSIPVKTILGNQPEGDYKVTLIGNDKNNNTVTKETTVHITPYIAPEIQESIRFSILYEFNESKSSAIYDKYLTEIVAPKITNGATVIISGYTDIIGETNYNKNLSNARANDVKGILEKGLTKSNTKNVNFEIRGFGEDESLSPFNNKFPEERFYNRTVVIDIIAKK